MSFDNLFKAAAKAQDNRIAVTCRVWIGPDKDARENHEIEICGLYEFDEGAYRAEISRIDGEANDQSLYVMWDTKREGYWPAIFSQNDPGTHYGSVNPNKIAELARALQEHKEAKEGREAKRQAQSEEAQQGALEFEEDYATSLPPDDNLPPF